MGAVRLGTLSDGCGSGSGSGGGDMGPVPESSDLAGWLAGFDADVQRESRR